jgi:pilus assembly protein Flp/PilA
MVRRLRKLLKDKRGATAVEYGLIVSLVVLAMLTALWQLAATTIAMWDGISERVVQQPEETSAD